MCVTVGEAQIHSTRTYVYATDLGDEPVHVCGYQNEAETLAGPNCMILNFPGKNLKLVHGPQYTRDFMDDVTRDLPAVQGTRSRSGGEMFGMLKGMVVEDYGDYSTVLSQEPDDILSMLGEVPANRRPAVTPRLEAMVRFYMEYAPEDSFVLACFDGKVKPEHPIVVRYTPRNPDILTAPGLDGHDGEPPRVGTPMPRDFKVAFAVAGEQLPVPVRYSGGLLNGKPWAPSSVAGFYDNRRNGLNGDYMLPIDAVKSGMTGARLADALL